MFTYPYTGSGAVYSFDPVGSYEREACRAAGAAQSLVQPFLDNQVRFGRVERTSPIVSRLTAAVLDLLQEPGCCTRAVASYASAVIRRALYRHRFVHVRNGTSHRGMVLSAISRVESSRAWFVTGRGRPRDVCRARKGPECTGPGRDRGPPGSEHESRWGPCVCDTARVEERLVCPVCNVILHFCSDLFTTAMDCLPAVRSFSPTVSVK